jgi:hypothetical protein
MNEKIADEKEESDVISLPPVDSDFQLAMDMLQRESDMLREFMEKAGSREKDMLREHVQMIKEAEERSGGKNEWE